MFVGYYGRDDLTSQVLLTIQGETCYATSDLGRVDRRSGELVFIGRRGYQVKLRGQRIELSTIESMIMRCAANIINCFVSH